MLLGQINVTNHEFDRRTDRETNRQLYHTCSAVKTKTSQSASTTVSDGVTINDDFLITRIILLLIIINKLQQSQQFFTRYCSLQVLHVL